MDFKTIVSKGIETHREALKSLSDDIWNNPELALKEYHAAKRLTDFFEERGFTVTRQYCGLETAFKAEVSNGEQGVHVCVICEYDALPDIGHACGHNLIAEAGVAAGLGLQAAIKQGLVGHVTVMGTPAEESEGGKTIMVERGGFDGVDIAMMVHPGPKNILVPTYDAMLELTVTYTGKACHAAAFPWGGVNALDAAVLAYLSLSKLRQQLKPSCQLHGVITEGGVKPEIIPERAQLYYFFRAPTSSDVLSLKEKVYGCFKGAATATGCTITIEEGPFNDNVMTNKVLLERYKTYFKEFNGSDTAFHKPLVKMGSTDMGTVSHAVPSIHPEYVIGTGNEHYHTHDFTGVTNTDDSHQRTLTAAKCMVLTCIDVMTDGQLFEKVKEQFKIDKLNN